MSKLAFFNRLRIRSRSRQRLALVMAAWLLAIASILCSPSLPPSPAQDIPKILKMGTSADYKPFEFHNTSSGKDEIVGFDIDIAKRLAQELGFELQIVDMDFNGLIPALQSQRVDFVMAAMTPTPERRQNIDFSTIYYEAKNTIISKKEKPFASLASLTGKKVGVQLGSTQQDTAQKIPQMQAKIYNRIPDIIQEVKAGRVDAAVVEESIARGYANAFPDLSFTVLENSEGGYAIAFPKGSALVPAFNRVLDTIKRDGTLDRLAKKWFEAQGKPSGLGFQQILPALPYIFAGVPVTLAFTLVSALFGFFWAVVLALAKISDFKPLRWLANAYTSIFRGTPLILQIALVYFATPQLTGYDIPAFQAGVIAFALNSGAYISETLRGGIMAVDPGQREAALSLGVSYHQTMGDIILPQAIRTILPALANEAINLLKDSALVSTIGAADLLRRASVVGAEKYLYFEPLLIVGLIYYLMVTLLTAGTALLEKRMGRSA